MVQSSPGDFTASLNLKRTLSERLLCRERGAQDVTMTDVRDDLSTDLHFTSRLPYVIHPRAKNALNQRWSNVS